MTGAFVPSLRRSDPRASSQLSRMPGEWTRTLMLSGLAVTIHDKGPWLAATRVIDGDHVVVVQLTFASPNSIESWTDTRAFHLLVSLFSLVLLSFSAFPEEHRHRPSAKTEQQSHS